VSRTPRMTKHHMIEHLALKILRELVALEYPQPSLVNYHRTEKGQLLWRRAHELLEAERSSFQFGVPDPPSEARLGLAMIPPMAEALDLLGLWYGRWTGMVVDTPDNMHLRTKQLLERFDRNVREPDLQKGGHDS
jgi:hypothetical protein